ncbi:MAG TPA: hypothetical protein VL981_11505 [Candidatus Methylacidiphilales bacterium]|nr:hypothetical protein [Candidatus Methylacidiphilales bacterium]
MNARAAVLWTAEELRLKDLGAELFCRSGDCLCAGNQKGLTERAKKFRATAEKVSPYSLEGSLSAWMKIRIFILWIKDACFFRPCGTLIQEDVVSPALKRWVSSKNSIAILEL